MRFDLHTHSIYSDGTWTPRQILEAAARQGLTAALTDHNTVSGLPEWMATAAQMGVEAVPGIEFSSDYRGTDTHVVALFVRAESHEAIRDFVAKGDRLKQKSNLDLVARLNGAGYAISYEDIVAQTPDGRVNRANIAGELVKKGYVSSVKEAFHQLLGEKCGYYTPPKRRSTLDTIAFIRAIGAVPVLAHPLLTFDEATVRELLPAAKEKGLLAMETQYSTYDEATTALARSLAAEYDLLESGGSDFHGAVKPAIALGQPAVSREVFDRLRQASTP